MSRIKKILFIFGTRPEAIKMAPLVKEFLEHKSDFTTEVCLTAQHREMLDQIINFFNLPADFDLDLMKSGQTLFDITARALVGIEKVLKEYMPDLIFVQGDTTTAFVGALAGYYKKVQVAHIEAGLRSFNKFSPFPEEANRVMISHIGDYHFVPTDTAKNNLIRENINDNIFVVGNTVIDALKLGLNIIKHKGEDEYFEFFNDINFDKRIILVTGHRRESFGSGFENICNAVKQIAKKYQDIEIVYPVHLNPNVQEPVNRILKGLSNVHLISPLDYPYLIWLMSKAYLVLTDSGGIQEEAPSLGKPVLVMRDVTERQEGVDAGTAKLVGTQLDYIVRETEKLLNSEDEYNRMAKAVNPYGDGTASKKIIDIVNKLIKE